MSSKIPNRDISYVYAIHNNTSSTYWGQAKKSIQDTRLSSTSSSNDSNLISSQQDTGMNSLIEKIFNQISDRVLLPPASLPQWWK